jgi:hypothetical protein
MPGANSGFLELALSSQVVRTAIRVSLIVGSILALINHGGAIAQMALSCENILQILLTYLVPYCVSTYSSVKALQAHAREHP